MTLTRLERNGIVLHPPGILLESNILHLVRLKYCFICLSCLTSYSSPCPVVQMREINMGKYYWEYRLFRDSLHLK